MRHHIALLILVISFLILAAGILAYIFILRSPHNTISVLCSLYNSTNRTLPIKRYPCLVDCGTWKGMCPEEFYLRRVFDKVKAEILNKTKGEYKDFVEKELEQVYSNAIQVYYYYKTDKQKFEMAKHATLITKYVTFNYTDFAEKIERFDQTKDIKYLDLAFESVHLLNTTRLG